MSTHSESTTNIDWADIARRPVAEREQAMSEAFAAVLSLDAAERRTQMAAMLAAERDLDEVTFREAIALRLRTLTTLTPDEAGEIMHAIDQAQDTEPADVGMRRVFALQGACRHLTAEEVSRVELFLPNLRELAGLPAAVVERHEDEAETPPAQPEPQPRRSFFARLLGR